MKYIDADRLKELLDAKYKEFTEKAKKDCPLQYQYMADGLDIAEQFIDSLQQEQPEKYIELNGIKYRKVPAKTNDKICKDCDYFLDNGTCKLVDRCPCVDDDTILERLQEQPEVDLENWKPSEEQMDRLFSIETALREDYCYHMADFLANLYADLKKLI